MVKKYSRKKKYKKRGGSVKNINVPEPFIPPTDIKKLGEEVFNSLKTPAEFNRMDDIYTIIETNFGSTILDFFKKELYSIPFDSKDMNDANNTNIYFTNKDKFDLENITGIDYLSLFDDVCAKIANEINTLRANANSTNYTESIKTIFLIEPPIKDVNINWFLTLLQNVFTKNIDELFLKYNNKKEEYIKFVKTLQEKIVEAESKATATTNAPP